MTVRRHRLAGNSAFWAVVGIAGTIRVAVMLTACCAAAVVSGRVADRGIVGLWGGAPGALPATVTVVLLVAGAAVAAVSGVRTARATVAFRRALRTARVEPPVVLRRAAGQAGLAGRVTAVADERPYALTHGLLRPRIVVSNGLTALLTPTELNAVLVHEHAHVRSRDPLKATLARILAGRYFFLPLLRQLTGRYDDGRELAADRHAVAACGVRPVAGALLKVVDGPAWAAAAPAAAMGSARLLEARIRQLETGTAALDGFRCLPLIASLLGTAVLAWALTGTAAVLAASPLIGCCTG